jgi:hypothetical protein
MTSRSEHNNVLYAKVTAQYGTVIMLQACIQEVSGLNIDHVRLIFLSYCSELSLLKLV